METSVEATSAVKTKAATIKEAVATVVNVRVAMVAGSVKEVVLQLIGFALKTTSLTLPATIATLTLTTVATASFIVAALVLTAAVASTVVSIGLSCLRGVSTIGGGCGSGTGLLG
jgi:chaperone required for assembly of F1-ATPase